MILITSLIFHAIMQFNVEATCCQFVNSSDFCLNTFNNNLPGTSLITNTFNTANGISRVNLQCGSLESNLKDFVTIISVGTKGVYTISTITTGDTTIQINDCSNNAFLGCNDNRAVNNFASSVTTPLQNKHNYSVIVSKFNSVAQDTDFKLSIVTECVCKDHTPDICLNNITNNFVISSGLTTGNSFSKITLQCGSRQDNLNDFIFNFQVTTSGTYRIATRNFNLDATTLQVMNCNGQFLACNSGNALVGSSVVVSLVVGTNYYGVVSKFDNTSREIPNFGISIEKTTSTPTRSPTRKVSTKSPTTTTKSPFSFSPTISQNSTNVNDVTAIVTIGGAVGGGVLLLAIGLFGVRRRRRMSKLNVNSEKWSRMEEARFRELYHQNHDFETLSALFPNHSKESIAFRIKSYSKVNTFFMRDSYAFIPKRLPFFSSYGYGYGGGDRLVSSNQRTVDLVPPNIVQLPTTSNQTQFKNPMYSYTSTFSY